MALTITSTTSPESDLQHAVSDSWRTAPIKPEEAPATSKNGDVIPLDKLPAKKFIEVRDQEVAEKKEAGPEFLQGEENGKPGKTGWQKRIDKVTRNWRTAESRAVEAERRAAELEARISGNSSEAPAHRSQSAAANSPVQYVTGAEKYSDFADAIRVAEKTGISVSERAATAIRAMANQADIVYFLAKNPAIASELLTNPDNATSRVGEISRDLLNFHKDVERRGSQETLRQQQLIRSHHERVNAALSKETDSAALVESAGRMPIAPSVTAAILEQDNSDAVAIHFARNPKLLEELNQLPPSAAMSRVGRIAERLEAKGDSRHERPSPPPPISPVGASSSRTSIALDELPPREYNRIRNQQERQRRRGL